MKDFQFSNSFIFATITFSLLSSDKGTTAILTYSVSFKICLHSFTWSKSMLKFSSVSRFSTLYHDLNFPVDNTFVWMKPFSLSNWYTMIYYNIVFRWTVFNGLTTIVLLVCFCIIYSIIIISIIKEVNLVYFLFGLSIHFFGVSPLEILSGAVINSSPNFTILNVEARK